MDTTLNEKVIKVLERVTGKKIRDFNLNEDLKNNLNLDSIQIVELFAGLEKELNIELPLKLMTVGTGKAFFELLENELNHQKA